MAEQRQATAEDLRRHMLRQILPTAYGTEAEQKVAQNAERKALELTAAQKRDKRDADDKFNAHQIKSLVLITGIEKMTEQRNAAIAAAYGAGVPIETARFSDEEIAACAAAGVDPSTLGADELAALVAATNMGK